MYCSVCACNSADVRGIACEVLQHFFFPVFAWLLSSNCAGSSSEAATSPYNMPHLKKCETVQIRKRPTRRWNLLYQEKCKDSKVKFSPWSSELVCLTLPGKTSLRAFIKLLRKFEGMSGRMIAAKSPSANLGPAIDHYVMVYSAVVP